MKCKLLAKMDEAGHSNKRNFEQSSEDKSKEEAYFKKNKLISSDEDQESHENVADDDNIRKRKKNGTWQVLGNKELFIYTCKGCEGRAKIAAYDMDATLIKTKSGRKFPIDANDWKLLYPEIPDVIKKHYENGFKIVILSNQGSLGTGFITIRDFKKKIERLVQKFDTPMQVYLAAGESIYRKPRIGMWEVLVNQKNDGVPVNKEESFFVGDAAGRKGSTPRKKDHSLADLLFATNLGLTFYTPEEHFLGKEKETYSYPNFNPKEASQNSILCDPPGSQLKSNGQEIVIMVGSPGSGKSHFVKAYLSDYFYVNKDFLRNWEKCDSRTRTALREGKSVVVDNTNPDKISRRKFINIAKTHNIPVRCFVMNLDREHIKHNIIFRILTNTNNHRDHEITADEMIKAYNKKIQVFVRLMLQFVRYFKILILFCLRFYLRFYICFYIHFFKHILPTYRKKYSPPSAEEGFHEIVRINFVPNFNSEEDRRLYEMYLLG